ncbi:MAG TPA: GAF domain-containing protein, partial [Gaiellaceae bacterium]
AILARLADLVVADADADVAIRAAVDDLHDHAGHGLVAILEHRDGRLVTRTARGAGVDRLGSLSDTHGLPARALRGESPVAETSHAGPDWLGGSASLLRSRVAAPIRDADDRTWGVLLVADEGAAVPPERTAFVSAVARSLGIAIRAERLRGDAALQLHRVEALRRIAIDLGGTLDISEILAGVVDHARTLFGAERAAASLLGADGRITVEASRGLSAGYLAATRDLPLPALTAQAAEELRPLFSEQYRDDPRAQPVRSAVVQEGFETLCVAPLLGTGGALGLVTICHD